MGRRAIRTSGRRLASRQAKVRFRLTDFRRRKSLFLVPWTRVSGPIHTLDSPTPAGRPGRVLGPGRAPTSGRPEAQGPVQRHPGRPGGQSMGTRPGRAEEPTASPVGRQRGLGPFADQPRLQLGDGRHAPTPGRLVSHPTARRVGTRGPRRPGDRRSPAGTSPRPAASAGPDGGARAWGGSGWGNDGPSAPGSTTVYPNRQQIRPTPLRRTRAINARPTTPDIPRPSSTSDAGSGTIPSCAVGVLVASDKLLVTVPLVEGNVPSCDGVRGKTKKSAGNIEVKRTGPLELKRASPSKVEVLSTSKPTTDCAGLIGVPEVKETPVELSRPMTLSPPPAGTSAGNLS